MRGEIRNPVEYLVQLLETDDFKSNNIDARAAWLGGILAAKSINTHVDDRVSWRRRPYSGPTKPARPLVVNSRRPWSGASSRRRRWTPRHVRLGHCRK